MARNDEFNGRKDNNYERRTYLGEALRRHTFLKEGQTPQAYDVIYQVRDPTTGQLRSVKRDQPIRAKDLGEAVKQLGNMPTPPYAVGVSVSPTLTEEQIRRLSEQIANRFKQNQESRESYGEELSKLIPPKWR